MRSKQWQLCPVARALRERDARKRKSPADLRSHRWFGKDDFRSFGHRSRAKQAGLQRRGHGRETGHRDPEHLERRESLPHALQAARRGRQARRLAGRRLPDGDPRPDAGRDVHEAQHDALSQPAGDGRGGSASRLPGRRRRPARRLRQDRAGAGDGRHERRIFRRSSCPPARCCAATGAARSSGRAPTLWKYWDEKRAGLLDDCAWREMEDGIARSFGTCMTMGTASTMAVGRRCARPHAARAPRPSPRPTRHTHAWPPRPGAASSRWCGRT